MDPRPPVEQFVNKLAMQAMIPTVNQGLLQRVEQFSIHAGAQGTNPTFLVSFVGKRLVGVEARASIGDLFHST